MEWTKDRSIVLSLICVYLFALILLAADIAAPLWYSWYVRTFGPEPQAAAGLATLYAASIFGWLCLYMLWKLLRCLRGGEVFTAGNIRLLRGISWCCAAVSAVFLVSMLYYPLFFVFAAAAAFMMLIVRIVKNIFQQAAEMKSDLDLTI